MVRGQVMIVAVVGMAINSGGKVFDLVFFALKLWIDNP